MRKRIVLILIILIFLSLIFIVLPRIGFYTLLFDQGEYEHSDESSTERISDLKLGNWPLNF